jgi:hypothetical protein
MRRLSKGARGVDARGALLRERPFVVSCVDPRRGRRESLLDQRAPLDSRRTPWTCDDLAFM